MSNNKLGGRVQSITTQSSGEAMVIVDSTATGGIPPKGEDGPLDNYFYYPDNMSKEILEEFKRAQNHSMGIHVVFDDKRNIISLTLVK